MRKLHYIILVLTMLVSTRNINAQQLSQDPLYQVVFQDEFDALSLDTSKWLPHYPWSPTFWNSNTLIAPGCYPSFPDSTISMAFNYDYLSGNFNRNRGYDTTGSGFHRLISRFESSPITGYIWNSLGASPTSFKFTTAMLFSRYKFKYAYIEMRYKLDNIPDHNFNAYGPNLWMVNSDSAVADYSEIDIFEERGTDWNMQPNTLYRRAKPSWYGSGYNALDTTLFVAHNNSISTGVTHPYPNNIVGTYNGGTWHTVGCEWTPDYVDYYYDNSDTLRRYADNKVYVGEMCAMPLLIDIYMPAMQYCIPFDSNQTNHIFNYDIDYVKVYQVKQHCISKSFTNTSSSTYADALYQNLTIGGTGGSAVFNSSTHHFAAQDYVLLQEGFEVSGAGTTLIVNTMKCQNGQSAGSYFTTNPPNWMYSQKLIEELKTNKQAQ